MKPAQQSLSSKRWAKAPTSPLPTDAQIYPPVSAVLSLSAVATAGCLGAGLSQGNGMLYGQAAEWLMAALACSLLGLLAKETSAQVENLAERLLPVTWLAAFAYAFVLWPVVRPALYLSHAQALNPWTLPICTGVAAVLSGYALAAKPKPAFWAAFVAAVAFCFLGRWLLRASPAPRTDVVVLHEHALRALVRGLNPHAITFPNIYPDISHYPPGLATRSEVLFGYAYPAINLLFLVPFYLVGDYRVGLLVAYAACGIGLYALGRNARGAAALILCLFMPRSLLMLENGWTEPLSALCLVGFLLCLVQKPRASAVLLGLFLASKQTMPLLAAAFFAAPKISRLSTSAYLKLTFLTACAATFPFVVLGPRAFWHSVIWVPFMHPFRDDAMTLLAWWHRAGGAALPSLVGFVVLLAMSGLAHWRLPKTPQGIAFGAGLLLLWFVAFNRQGFCNYYFVVIVAMAAAASFGTHKRVESV